MWGADLATMQLISKFNKGIRFLLCAFDNISKYAWVIPQKDKKGNLFKKYQMNLIANQTKYGFYNRIYNRSKTSLLERMTQKYIKENPLLHNQNETCGYKIKCIY